MSGETRPVLDLLRERRRELGIESIATILAQRRRLVLRGSLIGLALAGAALGLCGVVLMQQAVVSSRMAALLTAEAEAKQLQDQIKARQQKLSAITVTNQKLADALTSSRTSSALLAELQMITPQGVQLTSADVSADRLTLKGEAIDPYALVRVNALLLQLQRSPLFLSDRVKQARVERQPPRTPATPAAAKARPGQPPEPGPVTFEISADFARLSPSEQLAQLSRLGSDGMARRLRLIRQEGLMP